MFKHKIFIVMVVISVLLITTCVLVAGCGKPDKQKEPTAAEKYNEMIEEYRAMRQACDEVQIDAQYAESLKTSLVSTTERYNELYAYTVKLQAALSENEAKFRLLESQYNQLKSNYNSVLLGLEAGNRVDAQLAEQYEALSKEYNIVLGKVGKFDELMDLILMVSRRECPEINGLSASEQQMFYKGWNAWGTKYVAEFYEPFNLVPGSFDSLWSVIELVSDRQCYEIEQQLTEAEKTAFFDAWDIWRDKYADKYKGSDDFAGLLAVVLKVSRRECPEINAISVTEREQFYKGWAIWGSGYVQPIIP